MLIGLVVDLNLSTWSGNRINWNTTETTFQGLYFNPGTKLCDLKEEIVGCGGGKKGDPQEVFAEEFMAQAISELSGPKNFKPPINISNPKFEVVDR